MLASFRQSLEESSSCFGVRYGLEDGGRSIVECEDRGSDVIWFISKLFCHCMCHGEGGCGCPSSQYGLIVLRDGNEWVACTSCACKYCPTVIMPVDYEVCFSEKANNDCNEEGRYRGRILNKKPPCWLCAITEGLK